MDVAYMVGLHRSHSCQCPRSNLPWSTNVLHLGYHSFSVNSLSDSNHEDLHAFMSVLLPENLNDIFRLVQCDPRDA